MNTRVVITVVAALLTIATGISLAYFLPGNRPEASVAFSETSVEKPLTEPQPPPPPVQESSAPSAPQPETPGYLLREHEGKLGVFVGDSTEPEMIFDVYIRYLPEYDRQQLTEGIYIDDYARLVALIEDYIS